MPAGILCNHLIVPGVEKTTIFTDSSFPFSKMTVTIIHAALWPRKRIQGCQHFNTASVYMSSVFRVAGSAPILRTFRADGTLLPELQDTFALSELVCSFVYWRNFPAISKLLLPL